MSLWGNPKLDTLKGQMQWLTCNNDVDGDDGDDKSYSGYVTAEYDGDDTDFQQ